MLTTEPLSMASPPLSFPLLPYGLSTYASQATVNPIKSSEDCRKTTTNQPGIEQIPIPTSQTSFPEGEGKCALVSSRHRTCLSMKDRSNHECFLALTNLSINELTRSFTHTTWRYSSHQSLPSWCHKKNSTWITKCQTSGRGSTGLECSL